MNIPGMPAGMMPAQRVCQGDDPERAAQQQQGRDKKECKVTDRKQSGNRTTVSMSCSDGSTMVIDQQFNAARTEFTSTMSMKSKKDGDMTMTQTGRKIGACDAVASRKEREEKMAAVQKEMAAMQAAEPRVVGIGRAGDLLPDLDVAHRRSDGFDDAGPGLILRTFLAPGGGAVSVTCSRPCLSVQR